MNKQPIGIFDSGLGGLSVWKEIKKELPYESTIYYADSANCPYGTRSAQEITYFCEVIVEKLLQQGAKAIVVACNTATAAAIAYLRKYYADIPFIGMEPAIKPAARHTKTGNVGVLATQGTLNADKFQDTRQRFASHVQVFTQAGYGLVEAVESQTMDTPATAKLLEQYLGYMLANHVDQIVLGCTHYPFLLPQMEKIVGNKAAFINPAIAVAKHTRHVLEQHHLLNEGKKTPEHHFESSGDTQILLDFVQNMKI